MHCSKRIEYDRKAQYSLISCRTLIGGCPLSIKDIQMLYLDRRIALPVDYQSAKSETVR